MTVVASARIVKHDVPCNVCGSHNLAEIYADELGDTPPPVDYNFSQETRKTFRIVRCSDCGLVFTNPMPQLSDAYTETVDHVYLESSAQRERAAEFAVNVLARYKDGGRLLDVGCNAGLFLNAAAKRFQVEGVELSSWSADIASRQHKVYCQPISALGLKGQYDVITMWGVIEHLEDPRRELKALFEALKPEGIAAFYTGDLDAWLPRLLGKKWWWYQGMHLFYFSRRTLTKLIESIGFQVVEYRTHRLYFQLFSLAKSLNRYWVGRLVSPVLNLSILRNIMVPLQISGEMLLIVRKPGK